MVGVQGKLRAPMQGTQYHAPEANNWQQQGKWAGGMRDPYDQGRDLPWPEPVAGYLLVQPCWPSTHAPVVAIDPYHLI